MRRHTLVLLGGLLISAYAEAPASPRLDPEGPRALPEAVTDPTGTVTYDYATVYAPCDPAGPMVDGNIDGVTYVERLFVACPGFGTVFLQVFDPTKMDAVITNTIRLPATATSVTVNGLWYGSQAPVLRAFNSAGVLLDTETWAVAGDQAVHTVNGSDIAYLTVDAPNYRFMLFSLTVTYPSAEPVGPANRFACMNNGWKDFGFENQGQCVRFVETGVDSRG